MRVKTKLVWSLSQERPCIMAMQHSLHTLQFQVAKHISTLPPTWRVKASWAVRRLRGSSCSVISWSYFPLVSHKQFFPFGYFPARVHLLQITICTSREKSLSCVRRTGFQQSWDVSGVVLFSLQLKRENNFLFFNLSKLHYSESFLVQSWKLWLQLPKKKDVPPRNYLRPSAHMPHALGLRLPSDMKGQNKASS